MWSLWRFRSKLSLIILDHNNVQGVTISTNLWNLLKRTHSKMDSSLQPPSNVKGMRILDKKKFKKTITVPCLYLPSKCIQSASKHLKNYILKLQNFKPITVVSQSIIKNLNHIDIPYDEKSKMAVLDPRKVKKFVDLQPNDRNTLEKIGIKEECFSHIEISLNYDNWKADEIMRAIIPSEFDSVSGYSLVGHIVHLNLREHLEDYKGVIGAVLLDKVKCARSVVNKIDTIDSTYRNFNMELLSGDSDMVTEVHENKCIFKFDFSKVYWNPRLSTEHERITKLLKEGDIFYDVFAGVGPFSIPAAKRGCTTLANDLNPDSISWLKTNIKLNKIKNDLMVFNKEGNEFIKEEVKNHLLNLKPGSFSIHIVMNLPALAITFLHSFKNLFSDHEMEHIKLLPVPKLYVYTFAKGLDDPLEIALKAVEAALGQKVDNEVLDISFVRDVAPNKKMLRVTLQLTENILNNRKRVQIQMKKQQKKNNPFKVNHVRSIKCKTKAQPIKGQLKKLKDIVDKKISAADEKLKELVDVVRQPSKTKQISPDLPNKSGSLVSNAQRIENYKKAEENAEEALNRLEKWTCD